MGGGHTLTASNAHPETSAAGRRTTSVSEGSKNLDALLNKGGISHKFTFSPRRSYLGELAIYLNGVAPMLFK
jgi:hypothetical protein